jgi:hypothetical protein
MLKILIAVVMAVASMGAQADLVVQPSNQGFLTDTLFTADAVLMTADWLQTRGIALNCNSGGSEWETNPIMGHCPTMHGVNQYFLAASATLITLNWALPAKYRDNFMLGIGITEGTMVMNNMKLNIKMHF